MFTNYSAFAEDCLAVGTSSSPASGYPSESREGWRGSSALKSTCFAVIKIAFATF